MTEAATLSPGNRNTDSFFKRLNDRVKQLKQEESTNSHLYYLNIANHVLQLYFLNTDIDRNYLASLKYVLKNTPSDPDDVFYIWNDPISDYEPGNMCLPDQRWLYQGDEATITGSSEFGYISARRHDSNTTYLCQSRDRACGSVFTSHPFVNELNWWARAHGLFLIHSAAVGINGKGVLIPGFGRSGKTTLAMACLLRGMEYVADDYLLLDQNIRYRVYPIYSTGYMLPDSLELLPQLKKHALGVNRDKEDKTLIDLSPYFGRFAPSLDIQALVLPAVSDTPRPSLLRIPATQPMIQMVYSTARQNREEKNARFIRDLFACVKGLPTYRINLSRNVHDNAGLIEELIHDLR